MTARRKIVHFDYTELTRVTIEGMLEEVLSILVAAMLDRLLETWLNTPIG
jgi:hypothetical protein